MVLLEKKKRRRSRDLSESSTISFFDCVSSENVSCTRCRQRAPIEFRHAKNVHFVFTFLLCFYSSFEILFASRFSAIDVHFFRVRDRLGSLAGSRVGRPVNMTEIVGGKQMQFS